MPKLAQKAHFREKKRLVIKTKAFICKPREVMCVCVCVCVYKLGRLKEKKEYFYFCLFC